MINVLLGVGYGYYSTYHLLFYTDVDTLYKMIVHFGAMRGMIFALYMIKIQYILGLEFDLNFNYV
ncbi:hypothetical protein NBRC110019_28950 [Neptunitalea chrysea]|uniref:Uncharacterized protein n=1 Tax=Neptunitalea chrysea TaxID=1647581 RepID=A0A9W6EVI2_9FLAO|nr:hypothetical protein NBRC110019_28950 [Neptunitalea chrysea]